MTPTRIQLRRLKGWTLPENTVKVDRTTVYGNPFIVGKQGSAIICVYNYGMMLCGFLCVSQGEECYDRQARALAVLKAQRPTFEHLRGKNLACWCAPDAPCHADLLLFLVNSPEDEQLDIAPYLAKFGWRMDETGNPVRLSG